MIIVLFEPEIPWNTGNIGRTCVATGTSLHLVGKLGFKISDKEIRRSGLDYWSHLKLCLHESFEAFEATLAPNASVLVFSIQGRSLFWKAPYREDSYLVFGNESSGLPLEIRRRYQESLYRVPMGQEVRSLNLSTLVGIALYEGLRQTKTPAPFFTEL